MPQPLHVLIVEDQSADAELMLAQLRKTDYEIRSMTAKREPEFIAALKEHLDVILADYTLPDFSVPRALQLLKERSLDIPLIVVTGSLGDEAAAECIKLGASDYILKDRLARLPEAIAQALETRRSREQRDIAERALRDSEIRFRQLAENIHEVFYLIDADSTEMLYVSPAYEDIWRRSRASLYSQPGSWFDAVHPDDRAHVDNNVERGFATGRFDYEYRIIRPDASVRWIRAQGFPICDAAGNLYRIAGIAADITERKEAEEKIRRLNRVYAVLSGINTLIVHARDRQELFTGACRIAVEHGRLTFVWIGILDEGTRKIEPVAKAGRDDGYLAQINLSAEENAPGNCELSARALTRGVPVMCNDVASDDRMKVWRSEALKRGYRSVALFPLMPEGRPVGVFVLYAPEPDVFDDEEMRLLVEMAGDISFALEHIESQKRIETLSRTRAVSSGINSAIMRVHDRKELFRECCRIAVEDGQFPFAWIGVLDPTTQDVTPVAWAGESADELIQVKSSARDDTQRGKGAVGRAIRERRLVFNNDILAGRFGGPRVEEILRLGYRSQITLPLFEDNAVIGTLTVYAKEPDFFDEQERNLLDELAGNVSFALDTILREEKVKYLAQYDPLTRLANHALFQERLTHVLQEARAAHNRVAVLLCDIKRFRFINESLGRQAGDALLRGFAERLKTLWPKPDNLARAASNCFAGMLPDIKDVGDVGHLVERHMGVITHTPFSINGRELAVSLSIGIAVSPDDGTDAETLFRNAEAALKKTRESGEPYLFYETAMNASIAQTLLLENKMRRAIDNGQFVLHYQPKTDLASGRIVGLEALIRWNDPETGLVPPAQFIPLLEETGMILEAGRWAIRQALAEYDRWYTQGLRPPRIAVNVSPIQLKRSDFVDVVRAAIEESRTTSHGLDLEITESLIMEDIDGNVGKLRAMRDMGINIAIDDFGTGYSSLGYLARLPVTALKIDRSFIISMANSPDSMTIVSTIISLAHSLNLKVIAEGVETDEQAKFLRLLKCDQIQGYLISKPVPAQEIVTLVGHGYPKTGIASTEK